MTNNYLREWKVNSVEIKSKEIIENCTGRLVNSFCYPYGSKESIGNTAPKIAANPTPPNPITKIV